MATKISFSADERTLLVYCLDSLSISLSRQSQPEHNRDEVQQLLETVYQQRKIAPELCRKLAHTLTVWRESNTDNLLPVEALCQKLDRQLFAAQH